MSLQLKLLQLILSETPLLLCDSLYVPTFAIVFDLCFFFIFHEFDLNQKLQGWPIKGLSQCDSAERAKAPEAMLLGGSKLHKDLRS